ncbi:hypothetical protein CU280_18460 [Yersinia mollaretii]|nr:hypothetical protein CU280_18460 [Yersinia mollaretii]
MGIIIRISIKRLNDQKVVNSLSARGIIMIPAIGNNDLEGDKKYFFFTSPLDDEFRGPILFPTAGANRGSADTCTNTILGIKTILGMKTLIKKIRAVENKQSAHI